MRIQAIDNIPQKKYNPDFKSLNSMNRYGISALITSTSLFMLSGAIDSFESGYRRQLDAPAAVFGLLGTCMSIAGLRKEQDNDTQI